MRALKPYPFHIATEVGPSTHYVVAVTESDYDDFLADEQSKGFKHAYDYIVFEDEGGGAPFEWECYGAKIGRITYFGDEIVGACSNGYIESIGHFTSINGTAKIHVNHQLNMTFISDDIVDFFNEENNVLFKSKLKADPAHPYAYSKPKITIGSDVYIGAHAFINASKVTSIGHGAIIGAGAVVLEDVPPYAVVVGVPAKIKRYRFSQEMIETLLRIMWWEWSIDEINENAATLMSPEIFYEKFRRG